MSLRNKEGKKSSIRVSLYWIIAMALGLTLSVMAAIVIQAHKGSEINWQGISLVIAAIGVFISPAFAAKVWQKKYENDKV
jgi:membrane protein YdbS with pleckstrin-like domain